MKKHFLGILCLIFIFSLFTMPFSTKADISRRPSFVPGELLVKHKKQKVSLVQVEEGKTLEGTLAELKNDPDVEYAEPNYIRNVETISTNDAHRALLWGLDNTGQEIDGDWDDITGTADSDIDAPEAWSISEGDSSDVIVAVIDNGVAYSHPDLLANMWDGTDCVTNLGAPLGGCNYGYDYRSNDKNPMPLSGDYHGTHVAGIIGAVKNNTAGVIGVAPHVKIMAIRFNLSVSTEVKAIDFAIQNGAKIINASFGGSGFSTAEYDAISRFRDAGGIFVAAAGNDATDNESAHLYPSDYDLDNIISVAATDQNDALTEFSNFGATSVDVGAPGENILSTFPNDAYAYLSGTSMATPFTAGLAALIWGDDSSLSATEVKDIILNNGDAKESLDGVTVSGKRINAQKSLFAVDIISAQSTHDGATEGTDGGQYEVGSKATLQTAIDTATGVKDNPASTDGDITTAVANLDSAVATFLAGVVVPTDTTAPVITLSGSSSVTVKYRATYTDAGATATDDTDGDITDNIVVVNPVDTHTPGTYTVTYNVADAALNPAEEVTRTVIVSRASSGGGGGGGSSKPKVTAPAVAPSDCAVGFLFSPSTGVPCASAPAGGVTTEPDFSRFLFNFSRTLKFGMVGEDVLNLQKYLNTHGYPVSTFGVGSAGLETNSFGAKTVQAVKLFQAHSGLTADGVVGPMTASLMK